MTVMSDPALQYMLGGGHYQESIVIPAEEGSTEWSVATFFMTTDENDKIVIAEHLPYDVRMSAEVASNEPGDAEVLSWRAPSSLALAVLESQKPYF